MFLSVFFSYCVLQLLLNCCNVFADEDSFHRFIVDEGFQPAIFGSYYYDPIKDVFEPKKKYGNVSQIVNSSYVLSTAIGSEENPNATEPSFRHRVTIITSRPTQWWARKQTKNVTKRAVQRLK